MIAGLLHELLAKEGPIEQVSHVILLGAVGVWLWLWLRGARQAVWVSIYLLVLLGEEIDWGGVYGWHGLAYQLDRLTGDRNLHNAGGGASYLLFAGPLVLYFLGSSRWWGCVVPTRRERLGFGVIAVMFLAWNLTPWEAEAQELIEACLYGLIAGVGLRLVMEKRRLTA